MSSVSENSKKRKAPVEDGEKDIKATTGTSSSPPDGYVCNLCQQPGHWIQSCPDRRKHNQKQKRQKKKQQQQHVPVPGVDPSPKDIEAARKYQQWLATHTAPLCFCRQPSRLKKVKKNKKVQSDSRAIGKYFFFCSKKRSDNPCRFAKLAEEVMKEQKRKDKKTKVPDSDDKTESDADEISEE